MKISVRVKPNARKNEVAKLDEHSFVVHVGAAPVDGKANEQVIALLAEYFDKPKRSVIILHGASGRRKVIEIL